MSAPPVTRAIVLAAGQGTRLRPLTEELPKALVWLGDRPQIDGILAALASAGFDCAVVNTHHLAGCFDAAWQGAQPLEVALSHERALLGTGGALAHARALLGPGDVLVWNADIAAAPDIGALLSAHASDTAQATLLTGPRRPARHGSLGLDAGGAVVRIRSHDQGGEVASADYAGIAVLGEGLRARLSAPSCLVDAGLIPALRDGERVATRALDSGFADLGTPSDYLRANLRWLSDRMLPSFVHATASVRAAVMVDNAIVARSASVDGQGRLENVVVWPGAKATAPLFGAVVTPRGVLKLG